MKPVLDELVDATAVVRVRRLAELRASDPEAADELEALLARQTAVGAEGFLEGLAGVPDGPSAGQTIGSYTLDAPIGEGGMGTVWRARRSDGRFDATVAFKFLHLGVATRGAAARFAQEGRVLARLDHPHIARLLDAGVDAGRPYLVLEYVAGEPVDQWCDRHRLDIPSRLRLFLDVLGAVAHAHGRLILHRDIKPSNVLVDEQDGVKLLDFGIARLIDDAGAGTGAGDLTRMAGRAFTPAYAAPEQLLGEDVSTATDVYALGVLLYVLLTGHHPRAATGTAEEIARAVRDSDPRRPSTVASTTDAQVAGARATTPAALARLLRGDVDTIVAKALKAAPAERYVTAAAFADDLRRYLNHEPVMARPDAMGYRARRFVRRHWAGVAAATALFLALAGGVAGTLWQAREAARQRDLALEQLERAQTANEFVTQLVLDTWTGGESLSRDEFLQRSEQLAVDRWNHQPEQQSVVLTAVATFFGSLGNPGKALPIYERALALLPANASASWRASLECPRALNQWLASRDVDVRPTLTRWANDPNVTRHEAALCSGYLAKIALNQNDAVNAVRYAEQARDLVAEAGRVPPRTEATVRGDLGFAYALSQRVEESEREYRAALDIYEREGLGGSPNALAIRNNWSISAYGAGDIPRALELFEEIIAQARARAAGTDPPVYALANRGTSLLMLGRLDDATAQADEAYAVAGRAQSQVFQASALLTKAGAAIERADVADAERWLAAADPFVRALPPDNNVALIAPLRRAQLALLREEWAAAGAFVEPVIQLFAKRQMPQAPQLMNLLRVRGESRAMLGQRQEAMADAEEALRIARVLQGKRARSIQTGLNSLLVARLASDAGDRARARQMATEALTHLEPMLGVGHRDVKRALTLRDQP